MLTIRKGFTLIELLVVIAIIAILAAILFPVFAQAKAQAKKAADLSNIKQIGTAMAIYMNDTDDHWPYADMYPRPPAGSGNYGDMYRWCSAGVIGPYMKNTQILTSPLDTSYTPNLAGGWSYMVPTPPRVAYSISYMANALSNDLLGTNSPYFPAGVTDYTAPIAPGSYWDKFDATTGTPQTPSVTSSQPTNIANLIIVTGGAEQAGLWACGLYSENNTETISGCYGADDLFWGWDAADMASGTSFGGVDINMFNSWRKAGNQSNFSFGDTHAKSLPPGILLTGAFQLNPKYFLVNSAGY